MTQPLMLEGLAPEIHDDGLVRELRKENQRLEDELRAARQELDDVRAEKERVERSVRVLRQQLSPLHRYLRALFGEIELAIGEEEFSAPVPSGGGSQRESGVDPRWQSWKEKLPGAPAEMIDLLLLHKNMSTKALMTAMRRGKDTVYSAARKLNAAGLLATSQPYSLKSLE